MKPVQSLFSLVSQCPRCKRLAASLLPRHARTHTSFAFFPRIFEEMRDCSQSSVHGNRRLILIIKLCAIIMSTACTSSLFLSNLHTSTKLSSRFLSQGTFAIRLLDVDNNCNLALAFREYSTRVQHHRNSSFLFLIISRALF